MSGHEWPYRAKTPKDGEIVFEISTGMTTGEVRDRQCEVLVWLQEPISDLVTPIVAETAGDLWPKGTEWTSGYVAPTADGHYRGGNTVYDSMKECEEPAHHRWQL